MDSSNWAVFCAGMLASNVILAGLIHWIGAVEEILKSRPSASPTRGLTAQLFVGSLLNSGPWILLVAAYFAFSIRDKSWASSLFAGAAAWLLIGAILVTYTLWSHRHRQKK